MMHDRRRRGERDDADPRRRRLVGDPRALLRATIRLGLTSVARMLPETSIARSPFRAPTAA
jgi:hypothetical protein